MELQKKNREMKIQANQGNKSRKRKRHRKGVLYNYLIYFLRMELVSNTLEVGFAGLGFFIVVCFLGGLFGFFFNQEFNAWVDVF